MNWRYGVLFISALCATAGLAARPAYAQARVGEAAVIKNEVVRVAGSASNQINVGDDVLRDEIVRTGLDSAARLVMADSTNLSLGPNATITLDRTVFSDEHTYQDIAIKLTTGTFRFVTGHSEKAAYKISTPLATIGVRGTIRGAAGRRLARLRHRRPMRRADGARRNRGHHLDRQRQEHDSQEQHPALDLRFELRRRRRALQRHRSGGRHPHSHACPG
jgi:hypothetical protein